MRNWMGSHANGCDAGGSVRPRLLDEATCERLNRELSADAWEQRDDEAPPRLPRLKRRPKTDDRPLPESPKRLSRSAYLPETIGAFVSAWESEV